MPSEWFDPRDVQQLRVDFGFDLNQTSAESVVKAMQKENLPIDMQFRILRSAFFMTLKEAKQLICPVDPTLVIQLAASLALEDLDKIEQCTWTPDCQCNTCKKYNHLWSSKYGLTR